MTKIICVGNIKGGCGKTTITMHIITGLLYKNFKVASIDLDCKQKTLTSYIQNRESYIKKNNIDLPISKHITMTESTLDIISKKNEEEKDFLISNIEKLTEYDYIVIDTPGHENNLSTIAHSLADKIVTPLNDSFIDIDLIAKINDEDNIESLKPGIYSEIIWNAKKEKLIKDQKSIDWVVLRNRLAQINSANKSKIWKVMKLISNRLGLRVISGLSERVIYRELFLKGLTLDDLITNKFNYKLTVSHIAARQELRNLIKSLDLSEKDDSNLELTKEVLNV